MADHLLRKLGFKEAFALVIGSVIGTGVFLKTPGMLSLTGTWQLVMLAWVLAGLISLVGAFCYAELGSRYPQAGGEYVYLRNAYGDGVAFMYGWMRFWIGAPGSIAAYGVGAATFLAAVVDLEAWGIPRALVAIFLILFFSLINCLSVEKSGGLQALMTYIKLFIVAGLGILLLLRSPDFSFLTSVGESLGEFGGFGAAMLAALWAYDGWNNMPMAAGEIRDPVKNIPRALILGMLSILILYSIINLSYFTTLSPMEIAGSYSRNHPTALPVASSAALKVLGAGAVVFLSVVFVFSALGSMTGSILTGARVPYAMAKDGLFFKSLAHLHPGSKVPALSVLIQGAIACVLALSGTFDQLTDYVVFSSWIFYGLAAGAVLKNREGLEPGVYRVPGGPILPVLFILSSLALLANTLYTQFSESLVGLIILAAGLPVYFWFRRRKVPA